eukprot:6218755-Prymnesium_polylepis.1
MAAIADETQVKEMRWVTGSGRVEPWATVIENIVEDCRHAAPAQARTAVDQCRLARLCPSTLCARATAPVPSLLPQAQKGRAGARGVRLGHPAGKAHHEAAAGGATVARSGGGAAGGGRDGQAGMPCNPQPHAGAELVGA